MGWLDPGFDPYGALANFVWSVIQAKLGWLPGLPSMSGDWVLGIPVLIGISLLWLSRRKRSSRRRDDDEDEYGPRHTWFPIRLIDHLLIWMGFRQPHDLQVISGEHIDRRYYPHFAYGGATGSGKTNAVANTRLNGDRPQLIATFDFSGPLLGAIQALEKKRPGTTIVWTPQGEIGLDLFLGSPREIARRWTAAFEDNGLGQYKRAMRKRMARAIHEIDYERGDRCLRHFIEHLDPAWRKEHCSGCGEPLFGHPIGEDHPAESYPDAPGALEKAATESWLLRLEDLESDLAPEALGHDLDLAEALKAKKTVFLHVDAAVQDGTLAALVGIFVQENIRCIRKVRGGFRVIIEEAGAVVSELGAFRLMLQAGRVRGVYCDVILQSIGQLPEFFRQNIRGWVLFAQEEEGERRSAAARTGLSAVNFDERKLKRYYAWLKFGQILKRVKFGKAPEATYEVDWEEEEDDDEPDDWRPPTRQHGSGPASDKRPNPRMPRHPHPGLPEIPTPLTPVPSLIHAVSPPIPAVYTASRVPLPEQRQLLRIWAHHTFPEDGSGCHISTYRLNSTGRPGCSFGKEDWTTYVLMRTLGDAMERNFTEEETVKYLYDVRTRDIPKGGWGVDHTCQNKLCDNLLHLQWKTGARNTQLRWEREKARATV